MGVSENRGTLFGVLIIRILLFRVLYWGPLFSETPIWGVGILDLHESIRTLLSRLRALFSEMELKSRVITVACVWVAIPPLRTIKSMFFGFYVNKNKRKP